MSSFLARIHNLRQEKNGEIRDLKKRIKDVKTNSLQIVKRHMTHLSTLLKYPPNLATVSSTLTEDCMNRILLEIGDMTDPDLSDDEEEHSFMK